MHHVVGKKCTVPIEQSHFDRKVNNTRSTGFNLYRPSTVFVSVVTDYFELVEFKFHAEGHFNWCDGFIVCCMS